MSQSTPFLLIPRQLLLGLLQQLSDGPINIVRFRMHEFSLRIDSSWLTASHRNVVFADGAFCCTCVQQQVVRDLFCVCFEQLLGPTWLNELCLHHADLGFTSKDIATFSSHCGCPIPYGSYRGVFDSEFPATHGRHCLSGNRDLADKSKNRHRCCEGSRPAAQSADPVAQAVVIRADAPRHLIERGSGNQHGEESTEHRGHCDNENRAFRSVQHGGSDSMLRRVAA